MLLVLVVSELQVLVSLLPVVMLSQSLMMVKVEKSRLMPTVVMLSQSLTMVG